MKTLLFFRHGKSDWDADFDYDHERPLAKRGRKASGVMGLLLADIGQTPDRILCSSAVRAVQTLERARNAGAWTADVHTTDALYGAAPDDLLQLVRNEPEATNVLMLVGHEPTWSETIGQFMGGGTVRFPTAAMARIDLDITHWHHAAFGCGRLIWLIPPRLFS
ncbi:MAG: histidine phosphatase family protein [Rhodothermales bacterium]